MEHRITRVVTARGAIGVALGIAFAVEALAGSRFCVKAVQYPARTRPGAFGSGDGQTVNAAFPAQRNALVVGDVVVLEQPARQFGRRINARRYDDVTWLLRDLFKAHAEPPNSRVSQFPVPTRICGGWYCGTQPLGE